MRKKRILQDALFLILLFLVINLVYADYCEELPSFTACAAEPGDFHRVASCPTNELRCIFPDPFFDADLFESCSTNSAFYTANRDRCCRTEYESPYSDFCTSGAGIPDGLSDVSCFSGTPYSISPSSTQPCACGRGTQYRSITNACGEVSSSFDSACLGQSMTGTDFTPCGSDLAECSPIPTALLTDFPTPPAPNECREVAALNSQFSRVCLDLDTLQTLITATEPAVCDGPSVFPGLNPGVGCLFLSARPREINDTTPCGEGNICREGACVPIDAAQCSFLRDFLDIRASIDYPNPTSPAFDAGLSVPFAAAARGNISTYQWGFGDGSPMASGREVSHVYASPGAYTVTLTTFDRYECTTQAARSVTIVPASTPISPPVVGTHVITINQPEEGTVYSSLDVMLQVAVQPAANCSYQLNSQGTFASIVENPGRITAREGANRIVVRCGAQEVPRQFQVRLEQSSGQQQGIVQDLVAQAQPIVPSQQDVEAVLASISAQGNVIVTKLGEIENGETKITLRVRNEKLLPIANVKLRVTFPKDIVSDASMLRGSPFAIIDRDPVVEYDFGKVDVSEQKEEFTRVEKPLNQSDLDRIIAEVSSETDTAAVESIRQRQSLMDQFSDIARSIDEFTKDGITFSKVTTFIKPKKGLKNVSYYQEIPKCLAPHIDDLEFANPNLIKVVNPDPLIMWHFDDVQSQVELSFDVKGVIDEACLQQIKDLGLAEALGLDLEQDKTPKLLLTLLALPIIAIIFLYFGKFKSKLKKEEVVIQKSAAQLERESMQKAKREEEKIEDTFEQQIKKAEKALKSHLK